MGTPGQHQRGVFPCRKADAALLLQWDASKDGCVADWSRGAGCDGAGAFRPLGGQPKRDLGREPSPASQPMGGPGAACWHPGACYCVQHVPEPGLGQWGELVGTSR